jgi:hypothetical protein
MSWRSRSRRRGGMTAPTSGPRRHLAIPTSWLDQPLSGWWCVVGWLVATAVFIGLVQTLGGPAWTDDPQTIYATWAIAHGHLACAYPANNTSGLPSIAPLWLLLSGGVAALTGIGHGVTFPNALGPHCSAAISTMAHWRTRSGATLPTIRIGYSSWLVLMGGLVALMRASGRGRCAREPAVLLVAACSPPVWLPLLIDFHPQDLVAMGLALGGLACARRGSWVLAGALLGLALTSQQFALLVLVPLVVVAPRGERLRMTGAAIAVAALIDVPLIAVTSGRALSAVVIGSGSPISVGKTILGGFQFHGPLLIILSRILPIVLSMALACLARRRLGSAVLDPVPLASLVATSLCLRLVFEQNLFGYYFMAVAVSLLVLDCMRGRISVYLVAWLGLMTLAFYPFPWGNDPLVLAIPIWKWQIVLVTGAIALAAGPLISSMRAVKHSRPPGVNEPELVTPISHRSETITLRPNGVTAQHQS